MSVSAFAPPHVELFIPGKGIEAAKPIGIWRGQVGVIGDGAGGIAQCGLIATELDSFKYLWSLEEIYTYIDATLSDTATVIDLSTGEKVPYVGGGITLSSLSFRWRTQTLHGSASLTQAALEPQNIPHSSYICRPDFFAFSIGAYFDENINLRKYYMQAWGYIWYRQARTLAGGPSRP